MRYLSTSGFNNQNFRFQKKQLTSGLGSKPEIEKLTGLGVGGILEHVLFQLQKQLNEAEDEAESNSDAHNDELEMHAKLLKESKNSRDALKRLKNWLGENFNKPLIRK